MKKTRKVQIKGPKRNLLTLIIAIVGTLVLIMGIVLITDAVKVYGKNKDVIVDPFAEQYDVTNAVYMDGKDFDEFGLDFVCTTYNDDSHSASFKISTYQNDNIKTKLESGDYKITSKITLRVCVTAIATDNCKYSSEGKTSLANSLAEATSSSYYANLTISSIINLPFEIEGNIFTKVIDEPIAYVYVSYSYTKNGAPYTDTYILKYTYEDFNLQSGGVIA